MEVNITAVKKNMAVQETVAAGKQTRSSLKFEKKERKLRWNKNFIFVNIVEIL